MTVQTAIAIPASQVRSLDTGTYDLITKPAFPVTAQGDSQVLATMKHAGRIFACHMRVPATLGAGATLQLQKRDATTGNVVNLTPASTAATAGVVSGSGIVPYDFGAGDTIEVAVAGAATTTVAGIEVDLLLQHA